MPEHSLHTPASGLYVGLMSGTSLDGVDAVLVDFSSSPARLIATCFLPYPGDLADRLKALRFADEDELQRSALLGIEITRLYHRAIQNILDSSQTDAARVCAIGCHGQTVRHQPAAGYSIQLGQPALLVELTGIRVVTDFRSRDIAAGGQGAPLVPAFHDFSFRSPHTHRVILNIGGIANLTDLNPQRPTAGFDSGPGNTLMDAWIQKHIGKRFDDRGNWAATGRVIPYLLDRMLDHPYFVQAPPKSCGQEEFNLTWVTRQIKSEDSRPQDVQATLLELSARSIADAIRHECGQPAELLVCGGGARNTLLLKRLAGLLTNTRIGLTDELGVAADWVEAMAFAWLARQTVTGLPGNLPAVTGAQGPRILGAVYPR